jgi:hypothetical protein
VLGRHESFAANLGAKLMGPRLLKGLEGVFDGPILTTPPQSVFTQSPVTWLDIIEFSRAKPNEFSLTATPNGGRCCQFVLKGVQVEITEDDWRMIVSGALDRNRFVPTQPLEEDETAELATLEILEQRLKVLIRKADEVAGKARQLKYHLNGRQSAISSRRSSQNFSSSLGFHAVNQPGRVAGASHGYDLHADLMQQFLAPNPLPRLSSASSVPPTPGTIGTSVSTPRNSGPQPAFPSMNNRPSPNYHSEPGSRDVDEEYRALVTAKVEKLARGDVIHPPCDRCRRLKNPCIKHLTACQGCTKKHARCAWRTLTEEELAWLRREDGEGDDDTDEHRERGHSSHSAPSSQQDPGEPRRGSDRSEDTAPSGFGARIPIGRSADDLWRKGTSSHSRQDSTDMDMDPREIRNHHATTEHHSMSLELPNGKHDTGNRDPVMLSRMATAASAAVDGVVTTRGGPSGP